MRETMEIHFFTGKGGVGKSVLAAAQALKLARQGRKVLLVELGEQSYFQFLFRLPEVRYSPTPTSFGFDVSKWSGKESFHEYARHLIKVETLFKLFFENQVALSLVDAAPGLSELAILGKATSGPPRNVGPRMPYDAIVIDGYASGHFLALMKAPFGFSEAFNLGPMAEQTKGIIRILKDSSISKYHVVSQSEELMVKESSELIKDLKELLEVAPIAYLNKMVDRPANAKFTDSLFGQDMKNLFDSQDSAVRELSRFGVVVRTPWIFDNNPLSVMNALAEVLP